MHYFMDFQPSPSLVDAVILLFLGGAALSTTALVLSFVLRRRPALRYGVLHAAIISLLLCPIFAFVFTQLHLTSFSLPFFVSTPLPAIDSMNTQGLKTSDKIQTDASYSSYPSSDIASAPAAPNQLSTAPVTPAGAAITSTNASASSLGKAVSASPEKASTVEVTIIRDGFTNGVLIALGIWLMGSVMLMCRLISSIVAVVRIRRALYPIRDELLEQSLASAIRKTGCACHPEIMQSSSIRTPVVIGIARPVIVLPSELMECIDIRLMDDILLHELAHVIRGDNLVLLFQSIVSIFYWPVLTIHFLNRQLELAREDVCDNYVLQYGDQVNYAQTLLRLAELAFNVRVPTIASGVFQWRGKLESRVAGILSANRNRQCRAHPAFGFILICVFLVLSGCIAGTDIRSNSDSTSSQPKEMALSTKPTTLPWDKIDLGTPDYAGRYFGHVNGPGGKPLAGARIYVMINRPGENSPNGPGPVRALSDDNGLFDFEAPDMTYTHFDGQKARWEGTIVAVKDGYSAYWATTWGHNSQQGSHTDPYKSYPIKLSLTQSGPPLTGRLIAPDGKPLSGARVAVHSVMTTFDNDLDKFLTEWRQAGGMGGFMSSGPSVEHSLSVPAQIPGLTTETKTDAAGHFTIAGLGRDQLVDLSVTAPEIKKTDIMAMVREAPSVGTTDQGTTARPDDKPTKFIHGSGFTMQMPAGLMIRGKVIDKQTRQPVAGMWVGPLSNIVNKYSDQQYPWRTDQQGQFTIGGLDFYHLESTSEFNRMIVAATTPGLPYETGWGLAEKAADGNAKEMTIEVQRGIPFHLNLTDEEGKPVEAEVTYIDVIAKNEMRAEVIYPVGVGLQNADGSYTGFVQPGPGAILIKTHWRQHFRPAKVDPKAFFAPGKNDWTDNEKTYAYGTDETLITHQGSYLNVLWRGNVINQSDYSGIILVNPPADSKPLQLSASLKRYKTRKIYFVGPDGNDLSGIEARFTRVGVQDSYDHLRGSFFDLTDLSPDNDLRVIFSKENTDLAALLIARENGPANLGDLPAPKPKDNDPRSIVVQLHPKAKFKGRLIDEQGQPVKNMRISFEVNIKGVNSYTSGKSDEQGQFIAATAIAGFAYHIESFERGSQQISLQQNRVGDIILQPGEVRDVGDIKVKIAE